MRVRKGIRKILIWIQRQINCGSEQGCCVNIYVHFMPTYLLLSSFDKSFFVQVVLSQRSSATTSTVSPYTAKMIPSTSSLNSKINYSMAGNSSSLNSLLSTPKPDINTLLSQVATFKIRVYFRGIYFDFRYSILNDIYPW